MEIFNFTSETSLTEKDAKQMAEAINAFKEGKEQPIGRFTVIDSLSNKTR